jgi:transposase InsO family protein
VFHTTKGMRKDIKVFVGWCFNCIASAPNETTPRPRGEALHATKPNKVIHFDYLYMRSSVDDSKYVLIVKDDYSSYAWLMQCKKADTDSTAAVLTEWFAAFGVAQQWVSDQGSHFKNTVMADIQKQLGTNHHFTTAYSPWANGTVEAFCKQTIRAAKAMLSEMHLAPQEWPCVLPAICARYVRDTCACFKQQSPGSLYRCEPDRVRLWQGTICYICRETAEW